MYDLHVAILHRLRSFSKSAFCQDRTKIIEFLQLKNYQFSKKNCDIRRLDRTNHSIGKDRKIKDRQMK